MLVGPNTATFGSIYEEGAVMDCHDKVDEMVREANLRLRVRRVSLVFSSASSSSRKSLSHGMWVAVSEASAPEGALVSAFSQSSIWHQRVVQGMPFKPVSEFVVPGNASIKIGGVTSLSKAQMHKQFITGKELMDAIQESLFQGLGPRNQLAAWYDLTPYDVSLVQSIQHGATLQCVCSAFSNKVANAKDMALWLEDATKRVVEQALRASNWKEYVQEGYNTASFGLTRPVTDDDGGEVTLPLRQDTLTEWTSKFTRHADEFAKLVDQHNAEFNVSGIPWRQSHQAPARGEAESQAEAAADGVDRDSLSGGTDVVSKNSSVTLIFQQEGELYLHAAADIVIPASEPLFYIFGAYHSGAEVQQKIDSLGAGKMFPFQMESLDVEATFTHPADWRESFPKGVAKLKSFLTFLSEKQNVSQVDIVCHEYIPEPRY